MGYIGPPGTEYNIRVTIKETMYINKDSAVNEKRDSLHMLCDTFVYFTLCTPQVCFALESLLYIFMVMDIF